MSPSDTVYDRMKRNGGYITGSRHKLGPAMEAAAARSPEPDDDGEGAPPNLRDSGEGGGMESCGDCVHFEPGAAGGAAAIGPRGNALAGRGVEGSSCRKYDGYPVTANQVCDDYEPIEEESSESEPPMPGVGLEG